MTAELNRDVVFTFWTKWRLDADTEIAMAIARAVVRECWAFTVDALGADPAHFFFMKSPGRGADDECARQREREIWEAAIGELREEHESTSIDFRYLPVNLPVCSAWAACWELSQWTKKGSILAFPAMDLVETRLYMKRPDLISDDKRQRVSLIPAEVRDAVDNASRRFRELLDTTAVSKGLTIGGYKTYELCPELQSRRGGIPAKDLLEAGFRCYASGALSGYQPFEEILKEWPDLRTRSEIIAMHRESWLHLEEARRLISLEPWEATIQLILGCLLEGCSVKQVDFKWMVEPDFKSDEAIVEQFRRGFHVIERTRQFWFASTAKTGR